MAIIALSDLSVTFENAKVSTPVLKHIDLSIDEGSRVAIVGRSGSGKSTLMNVIGLMLTATSGRYVLGDRDVSQLSPHQRAHARNRHLGFVFQQYHLLPRLNVLDNISLPLTYERTRKLSRRKAQTRAELCLDMVGLSAHAAKRPATLSGGEQQRVSLARALVNDPSIILADEPTGALDTTNGEQIMQLLGKMSRRDGKTIVIVTHDLKVAAQCDRRIHLADGMVVQDDVRTEPNGSSWKP